MRQMLLSWGYFLCVSSSGSCFLLHTVFRTRLMAPFTMMADGSHASVYARTASYKDQRSRHSSLNRRCTGLDMSLFKKPGQIIGCWSCQTDIFIFKLCNLQPIFPLTTHNVSFGESYYAPFILQQFWIMFLASHHVSNALDAMDHDGRWKWRAHAQTALYKEQRSRPCSPNRRTIGFDMSSIWGQIIRGRWSYQPDVFICFLNDRHSFFQWTTHIFSFDESCFILWFRFFNPQNLKNSFPKMAVSVAVNEWINHRIWKH